MSNDRELTEAKLAGASRGETMIVFYEGTLR
jgi:hypothetical protein